MHYSICDYLSELVENSIEAKAPVIIVDIIEDASFLHIYVADTGCGMDRETVARVVDPFMTDGTKHANRKVGLGLSFLKQLVDQTDGIFEIDSEPGSGTSIHAGFNIKHIDTPPFGDLVATIISLMTHDGEYELTINKQMHGQTYSLSRLALIDALGSLNDTEALSLLKKYIMSQETNDTNS